MQNSKDKECYRCGAEQNDKDVELEYKSDVEEWFCEDCIDTIMANNRTGYCSFSCCFRGNCDDSC